MMHFFQPYVERFPLLASTYRRVRDQWNVRRLKPRQTPWGFTLRAPPSMIDGSFEPHETALVIEWATHIDVFVDVGAHVGLFTCLAASRGLRTVSFEPMANNLTCLLDNLRRNHYERAEVFPVGMAAEPGVRTLYGAATGASLNTGWAGVSEQYATTIPVNTLDNVLRGRFAGERLFIKMDIEGAEWECLQGAVETLDRSPAPAWLIEICLTENLAPGTTNPHFGDVFTLFRTHGYACHTVDTERREVTEADVTRWVANGHRDFGTYNFLFTRDQAVT